MGAVTWAVVAEKLLFWSLGALCSGGVAYIVLGQKLSFMKGQLKELLRVLPSHEKLKRSHAALAEELHLHKGMGIGDAHPSKRREDSILPTSLHG